MSLSIFTNCVGSLLWSKYSGYCTYPTHSRIKQNLHQSTIRRPKTNLPRLTHLSMFRLHRRSQRPIRQIPPLFPRFPSTRILEWSFQRNGRHCGSLQTRRTRDRSWDLLRGNYQHILLFLSFFRSIGLSSLSYFRLFIDGVIIP